MRVVVQPSYGNADSIRHWHDTLERKVPFEIPERSRHLAQDEVRGLLRLHPDGKARFWGTNSHQRRNIEKIRPGDVVLFTGKKLVRAVGKVGALLLNDSFSLSLWDAHPTRGPYCYVYSVVGFQETEIPYEEIWALPGFKPNTNFQGLWVPEADLGATLLEGLGIQVAESSNEGAYQFPRTLDSTATRVEIEAVNTLSTSFARDAHEIVVNRDESKLVRRFVTGLGNLPTGRLQTSTGICDLYISRPDGLEIVEAKSSAKHRAVRDALGQLLDYARTSPGPVTRLSGLFPARPSETSTRFLHGYGIDCVFLDGEDTFARLEAPDQNRSRMRGIWHDVE